jgi:hypothetical protein
MTEFGQEEYKDRRKAGSFWIGLIRLMGLAEGRSICL